jgi:hypothetical protein
LLSDKTAIDAVGWRQWTESFFDLRAVKPFNYRKSDVLFPSDEPKGSDVRHSAVIELQIPTGVTMDAIQIGKKNLAGRFGKVISSRS